MDFQIENYIGAPEEDKQITLLLTRVYVEEGYTDKSDAEKLFASTEVKRRGDIILARSESKLVGMIICVRPTSPSRQITKPDEAEIHLLAVSPEERGHGIGSHLIVACEQRAVSNGYSKIVLSTQQAMKEAHTLYKQLGYKRNSARDWSKGTKSYHVYEKHLDNHKI